MLVINLFGGPGIGKSAIAAKVFSRLKLNDFNIDIAFLNRYNIDRLSILAEQNSKFCFLKENLEYLITPSPLLVNIVYNWTINPVYFNSLVLSLHQQFDNLNIYLVRGENEHHTYNTFQIPKEEALKIDRDIKKMLDENQVEYTSLNINNKTDNKIIDLIYKKKEKREKS